MNKDNPKTAAKDTKAEAKDSLVKVDRNKYVSARSASGAKSLNNGDEVAIALAGLAIETLYKVADSICGDAAKEFRTKYAKLNVGMQRMNLGNRIRGAITKMDKGKDVKPGTGVAKLISVTAPLQKEAKVASDKAAASKKAKSDQETDKAA